MKSLVGEKVVIGTSGDYPPFSFMDPKRTTYKGLDIDAAERLQEFLGVNVTFVGFAWPELVDDLLAGRFDIAMGGVSRSLPPGREVAHTRPYMTVGVSPLVRQGDQGKYTGFAAVDQPNVRVILNQGGSNDRYFTPRIKNARVLRHDKNEEIALKVRDGQADVWITDSVEALYWAGKLPGLVAAHPTNAYTNQEKVYLTRQEDQALLERLNGWIERMLREGVFKELQKKWIGMEL